MQLAKANAYFGFKSINIESTVLCNFAAVPCPNFMRGVIYLIILLFSPILLSAQEKFERERRIAESDVPENAVEWFNETYPEAKRVKWYAEITSGKNSFEAKLKVDGARHSVEFSEQGLIEDVEIEVDAGELPDAVRSTIEEYMGEHYSKYNFRKIQQQWSGPSEALKNDIQTGDSTGVTLRYEVEYYAVDSNQKALWEGLFDTDGRFIRKREIILRPTDNLNY